MDDLDRPPLGSYAYEEIAKDLHEVDKEYWAQLSKLRFNRPVKLFGLGPHHRHRPDSLSICGMFCVHMLGPCSSLKHMSILPIRRSSSGLQNSRNA